MADQSSHAEEVVTVQPMSAEEERAINDLPRRDRLSPYEVTERQLQAIEEVLGRFDGRKAGPFKDTIRHVIDGIRAGAPPEPDTAQADELRGEIVRLQDINSGVRQQRDLLDRACASYIERQAAEKAASGLITLATASAWANEQRLLISTAMGQIANAQSALHGQEEVTLP